MFQKGGFLATPSIGYPKEMPLKEYFFDEIFSENDLVLMFQKGGCLATPSIGYPKEMPLKEYLIDEIFSENDLVFDVPKRRLSSYTQYWLP